MQPAHRGKRICIERVSSHAAPGSQHPNKLGKRDCTSGGLCDEAHSCLAVDLRSIHSEQLQMLRGTGSITPMGSLQHTTPQLDGPLDYRPQMLPAAVRSQMAGPSHNPTQSQLSAKPHGGAPKTAINDILPYCTTEVPLTEAQVIGMSDIAGNLKEVMLLALHARMDERVATDLVRAVGPEAASGIVEFFSDEFEVGSV